MKKTLLGRAVVAGVLGAMVATLPLSAQAATWSFEQGGWGQGGTATLSFTGTDANSDGFLTLDELSSLSLSQSTLLTEDSRYTLRDFTLSDLSSFNWDMADATTFGDAATDALNADYLYGSGWSVRFETSQNYSSYSVGRVEMFDETASVFTAVSAVPEPGQAALFLGGLGLLAGVARRRQR